MDVTVRMLTSIGNKLIQRGPLPRSQRLDCGCSAQLAAQLPLDAKGQRSQLFYCDLAGGGNVRLNVFFDQRRGFGIALTREDKHKERTASYIFDREIEASQGEIRRLLELTRAMYGNFKTVSWNLQILLERNLERIKYFMFWHHADNQAQGEIKFGQLSVADFQRADLAAASPESAGQWLVCDCLIDESLRNLSAGAVQGLEPLTADEAGLLRGAAFR